MKNPRTVMKNRSEIFLQQAVCQRSTALKYLDISFARVGRNKQMLTFYPELAASVGFLSRHLSRGARRR
jgi:hypothetical protein